MCVNHLEREKNDKHASKGWSHRWLNTSKVGNNSLKCKRGTLRDMLFYLSSFGAHAVEPLRNGCQGNQITGLFLAHKRSDLKGTSPFHCQHRPLLGWQCHP